VLNLTRRNYLRYYLSEVKAQATKMWHSFDKEMLDPEWLQARLAAGKPPPDATDTRIELDIEDMLETMERCHADDLAISTAFADYHSFFQIDYDELFPTPDGIGDAGLKQISRWLGLATPIEPVKSHYKKISTMALEDTILNFDEVVAALEDTPFAYCLLDERAYRLVTDRAAR
jgi:hypothetical protein